MNQPEKQDPLETMLQEQHQYVNDDGFTARVVAALPRRRRTWLGPSVLLGASVIGSMLAGQWLPWGSLTSIHLSALATLDPQVLMPWVTVVVVMGSIAWAAAAALQWND
jgi:hypothetical protein